MDVISNVLVAYGLFVINATLLGRFILVFIRSDEK